MKHVLFGLALGAAALLILVRWMSLEAPRFAAAELAAPALAPAQPFIEQGFVFEDSPTPVVHSGALVELTDGSLLAAWFGGSREGAKDVAIYAARRTEGVWSQPFVMADRADSEQDLQRYIRKLGNPVLLLDAQQRLWLFYVTVSIGGWSTSSISYKISSDNGHSWSRAQRLLTSPLLNISTLVRGRALLYADGSIGLPVYHELAGKFGEWLRIDSDGEVLGKSRMGSGRSAIQPSLLLLDQTQAIALLRRVGRSPARVMLSESHDAGLSWSEPTASNLANPDASVAAINGAAGVYLLAYNPEEQGRNRLGLARSSNGRDWGHVFDFVIGQGKEEFSYPYLIRDRRGDYHLIYTWLRQRMAYVRFNQAWLDALE